MSILDLFRLPKDPTKESRFTNSLFIGKLYSATHFDALDSEEVPLTANRTSDHYMLMLKFHDKYYVVPRKDGEMSRVAVDINDVTKAHELLVQPDSEKRFKPFTYYAPSAQYGYVTPEELTKLARFVHHYFVTGDDHAHRRDLDVYYKFLKDMNLTAEEKERLEQLKDFARKQSNTQDDELSK